MKGYMLDKFTFILNKSRYYNTSIDTTNAATTYYANFKAEKILSILL